ncbi:MAG: HAMP domain-containing histidine kinase [Oscillospiraceae bacterium]|nr:HAMP domain-containing histidine kinase [Oscillospiraceae bacterium]
MEKADQQENTFARYLSATAGCMNVTSLVQSLWQYAQKAWNLDGLSLLYRQGDILKIAFASETEIAVLYKKDQTVLPVIYRVLDNGDLFCASSTRLRAAELRTLRLMDAKETTVMALPLLYETGIIGGLFVSKSALVPECKKIQGALTDVCEILAKQLFAAVLLEDASAALCENQKIRHERDIVLDLANHEKKVRQLYAMLSHEFKTPLGVMLTSMELLRLKLKSADATLYENDYCRLCDIFEKNIYLSLRLTGNLMDAAKMESGEMELNLSHINFFAMVKEAVFGMEAVAKSQGITFLLENEAETDIVYCDGEKTERILLNLLSNAVRAVSHVKREDAKIVVVIHETDTHLCFSVSDNGEGISAEALPCVFDRFYRAHHTETRDGGTGLGLAVAKEMARLQDGDITVQSKRGKGSRFTASISKNLLAKMNGDVLNAVAKSYQSDQETQWRKMEANIL